MIGRVSHFYGDADRGALNRLKHRLYELVAELQDACSSTPRRPSCREAVDGSSARSGSGRTSTLAASRIPRARRRPRSTALREELGAYLDQALDGFGARAYEDLVRLTAELPRGDPRRSPRALRRVPLLGTTTYPARALSEVAELDEVRVVRVSPLDTTGSRRSARTASRTRAASSRALRSRTSARSSAGAGARTTICGAGSTGPSGSSGCSSDPSDEAAKEAFGAITAEEAPKLTKAKALVRRVQEYSAVSQARFQGANGFSTPCSAGSSSGKWRRSSVRIELPSTQSMPSCV